MLSLPLSSAQMIVDLSTRNTTALQVIVFDMGNGVAPPSRNKFPDGAPFTLTATCFNKNGDLVYVGNSKGEMLIIDQKNVKVLAMISISGGAVVKNIVFSRN